MGCRLEKREETERAGEAEHLVTSPTYRSAKGRCTRAGLLAKGGRRGGRRTKPARRRQRAKRGRRLLLLLGRCAKAAAAKAVAHCVCGVCSRVCMSVCVCARASCTLPPARE